MAQTIVANGNLLDLSGTINTGGGNGILVEGTSSDTDLILTASTTLTGAGTVTLEGAFSRIYGNSGSGNALDNQNNLIEGSGQIGINNGGANLTLINEAAGTIDANTTATLGLFFSGSPAASNAGLMEATGSGGLLIEDGTVNNSGTVLASGAGDNVVLSNADLVGGTLATTGGGLIETASGTTNSLDGSGAAAVTITAGSTVQVTDNSQLNLDGTIDNAGTIVNATTADNTNILVNTATVTLTGGGTLDLGGADARIYGTNGSGNTLDLVNQTILGAGQIGINNGGANLTLVNAAAGTIDANTTATLGLYLAGSPAASNAGLMEATGSGGLLIQDGTVNNTGTVLARGAGHNVVLSNATIAGGKLATTGGGLIETAAGTTNSLNGSSAAVVITAHSTVQVTDNSSLNLDGTIDNAGTILDNAGTDDTNIILAGTLTALTGGGVLDLGSATARIYGNNGSANTLDLVRQTILGAGQIGINIGGANLTLVNTAGGTIDANTTATLGLYLAGSPAASNAGLMEATGSGGLLITGGTVNNTGTVLASGAGDNVVLSNATIAGGRLASTGGGLIETATGTTNSLDGSTAAVTITAGSTVQVTDNSSLNLDGTIDNAGTIVNATTADYTNILVNTATVTLTGGGTLDMAGAAARIYGPNASGNTLDLVNQTILGAGQIGINNGGANLTLVNAAAGTIDASTTATLGLDLAGSPAASNAGLMEATGSGGLLIADGTVNNTGTIQASGTNDNVVLSNATIAGGKLATTGGGLIETAAGTTNSLDGSTAAVTITAGSTVQVTDNSSLNLDGTIDNAGTIVNATTADYTNILVNTATVTLTGGGTIDMAGAAARIYGPNASGNTLDLVNQTILGAGQIGINNGGANLTLVNAAAGTIDASTTATLGLDLAGSPAASNAGLMEATGSGGLLIADGTVNNTGTIQASGTNDNVVLSNATIAGGRLASTGGGLIETATGSTNSLNGSSAAVVVTAHSTVQVTDNSSLNLDGTIDNAGTIVNATTSDNTRILVNTATVTLTGGGTIDMAGPAALIYGPNASGNTLDLVNQTILGAGQIGINNGGANLALAIGRTGTIDASGTTALTIQPGGPAVTNNGVLEATGTGGLVLLGTAITVGNTGTVQALDGSSVSFDSNVTTTNNSGGTLSGGTWSAISTGDAATLSITGGSIVVDKATIVLSGANSVVQSLQGGSEVAIETSLKTIDPHSELAVLGGRNYTTTNSIADSGLLQLGGGTFTAGHLAVGRTGTLAGNGTVATSVTNSGLIEANGTLDLTRNLVNNAQVTVEAGTVILGGAVVASTGKVGSIAIGTGTDAKFLSTVSAAESAVFTGTAGTLTLDKPTRFAGTIDQFGTTDTIDLALLAPRHVTGATIETGNKLVVLETTGSITLQLDPNQSFAGLTPLAGTDGSGGTAITLVGSVIAAARPSFIASPSAPAAGPDMAAMFTAGSPLSDALGGLVPAGGDVIANPGSPDLGAAPFGSGPDGTALWLSQSHTAGPPLLAHGN